jgi:hypothetical protein
MTCNPLVPEDATTIHVVLDDLGRHGRVYREINEAEADFETLVEDILAGQYYSPQRIVAFSPEQGWARDVTEDVAREVFTQAIDQDRPLLSYVQDFVERALSGDRSDDFDTLSGRDGIFCESLGSRAGD